MATLDAERYLERIGLDRAGLAGPAVDALATLQSTHARSVPFETLSITGDPHGEYDGEPIELSEPALYEKIVERERGGFCYELNGAFAWLLDALGFDVRRCAARIAADDGGYGPPADHLALIVTLEGDRPDGCGRYLVDVGVGAPVVRRPVPLDGSVAENGVGVDWRLVEPDRQDADYRLEYRDRTGAADGWTDRYLLRDEPRERSYFAATCEYHSTAPDSHFTGDPIAMRPTLDGHVSLSPETLTRTVHGERERRAVDPEEYRNLLATEFDIQLDLTGGPG